MRLRWAFAAALLAILPDWAKAGGAERWHAVISPSGRVQLSFGRRRVATIVPGLFEEGWRLGTFALGKPAGGRRKPLKGELRAPGGAAVDCQLRPAAAPGGVRLAYKLTPRAGIRLNSLHVSVHVPIGLVAGGEYVVNGEHGRIPAEFERVALRSGPTRSVALSVRGGRQFRLDFGALTPVLLQDNRRWDPSFSVRIGPQFGPARAWPAGRTLNIVFDLTAKEGIDVEYDTPVTIEAGPDWIPLEVELDIVPGSALDFSGMGRHGAPAGRRGWLIARPDGRFAFEKDPGTPRRFYGVNLCFGAHYIPHDEADRLADRLVRIGYNAVRFHHYEGELVDRSKGTSTALRGDKLDQLDYLFAALKKRGLYVTTDLFVSRPVFAKEIWDGASGDAGMDNFKMLVPVNARAFENWKAFARNLLAHVNPYTGLSYAKDPALAWLSMINEGNPGNYLGRLDERTERDWRSAWNEFLAKRYGGRGPLEEAWGAPAGISSAREARDDPLAGTVPLFKNPYEDSPRGRDLVVFLAETERDMFRRMKRFLREELGARALLTDMNGWTNRLQNQAARAEFDYVDDHFYVDHPRFLERPWRLPSRCDNASPIAGGAAGGRHCSFVRLLDKPFTVSEYNYSGPGRFRGVGGIITGCMAALQDWGAVWRFTYSHSRDNLFKPSPAGYFDLATDPLNQAAERAAICLYLRGDMRPAPHTVGIAMTSAELLRRPERIASAREAHNVAAAPSWHALALVMRVGTFLADRPGEVPADLILPLGWKARGPTYRGGRVVDVDPYGKETGVRVLEALRERGWLGGNLTDLSANRIQSETGEFLVDARRDAMVLDTPMTAGGYAPEGETIEAGAVTVTIDRTDATVWVSSVDGEPIRTSRRLIITHLTDLQNTGARFGERARQTLLAWGRTPHLVRAGTATVTLQLREVQGARVWALATSGRRMAPVETEVRGGRLVVPLDVAGPAGARMIYEVEVR